jgi:N-acetylmuramoyl-L-alanine amidase
LTQEEIELIALVTMAEAEGEPEEGQRLVIDTILNRVDSDLPYFPDTVHDVVYQKNAFSSMWDGRADRCYVMEELCQLVREELQNRTNREVLYFTAGEYGKYGTPVFRVANHYFCEA